MEDHKERCIKNFVSSPTTAISFRTKANVESIMVREMQAICRNTRTKLDAILPVGLNFFKNVAPDAHIRMVGPGTTLKKVIPFDALVPLFKTPNWAGGRAAPHRPYRGIDKKTIELHFILRKSIKYGSQGISILDSSVYPEVRIKAKII